MLAPFLYVAAWVAAPRLPTCATTCRSGVVTAQESADAYDVAADDDTDVGNRLQGMVASTRRSTDISKAADKVHTLGPLAGRAMPPVYSVDDPELESAHSYSRSASWQGNGPIAGSTSDVADVH